MSDHKIKTEYLLKHYYTVDQFINTFSITRPRLTAFLKSDNAKVSESFLQRVDKSFARIAPDKLLEILKELK